MNEDTGAKSLFRYLCEKKSLFIIIAALILGGVLMMYGSGQNEHKALDKEPDFDTADLEKKVAQLCENVVGVDDVRVMITADTVSEKLYAKNSQQNSDYTRTEYVTVSGGLLEIGERAMTVRGVAVVCTGGDDADIKLKLTGMICALFDIGADRVSVIGGK